MTSMCILDIASNEEVLVCAKEAKIILKTIWHRKHNSLGIRIFSMTLQKGK